MDKTIKISGSIGIKIITNKSLNKKIFIFYDDHSNTKYCDNKTSKFISQLFDKIIDKDVALILEEPFMDNGSKIKILWEDSEHLTLFRKFYSKLIEKCSDKKICKIFPFDIRLSIFDISPDEIINNINEPIEDYKIKITTYMQNINYLFDLNDYTPKKNSIIHFIKKIFNIYKNTKIYKELKNKIIEFNEKHEIYTNNETILDYINKNIKSSNFKYDEGFPFINNHNKNFIDQLDKIASGIMEMYAIILTLLLPQKNIIIYAGYFHSNNLSYIFTKYYNFEEEYKKGVTDNLNGVNNETSNCLDIPTMNFTLL